MRVLIGCECSGVIRREFRLRGHEAYSCDIKPAEDGGEHIEDDVRAAIHLGWDLFICHPDCTMLTVANAGHIKHGCTKYDHVAAKIMQREAADFFMHMVGAPIYRIAIENPVGIMSSIYRKPDQIIQPYEFGDDASKATCLWLKNIPRLTPTKYVDPRIVCCGKTAKHGMMCEVCRGMKNGRPRWSNQTDSGQNRLGPSETRSADRARTYPGIARAMAEQWGRAIIAGPSTLTQRSDEWPRSTR